MSQPKNAEPAVFHFLYDLLSPRTKREVHKCEECVLIEVYSQSLLMSRFSISNLSIVQEDAYMQQNWAKKYRAARRGHSRE
jgi:hypothetical protein